MMASKSVIEMMKFNDGIATDALGVGSAVQDAFKSMKDIEGATMPSSVRLIRDMQRGLETGSGPGPGTARPDRLPSTVVMPRPFVNSASAG